MRVIQTLVLVFLLAGCNTAAGLDGLEFLDDQPGQGGSDPGDPSGTGGGEDTLQCPGGDPASGDSDGDGLCDAVDPCVGSDNGADADHDGFCDSVDRCPGNDATADADADGLCDDDIEDTCVGTSNKDSDEDGVCDELDLCPDDRDNLDGTCTKTLLPVMGMHSAATLGHTSTDYVCAGGGGSLPTGEMSEQWTISHSMGGYGTGNQRDAYLSFDTAIEWTVESATLTVHHVAQSGDDTVELHAPASLPGWNEINGYAYSNTNRYVDGVSLSDAEMEGTASFEVDDVHVNADGLSQFRLSIHGCPTAAGDDIEWTMFAPNSEQPPTLAVTYRK